MTDVCTARVIAGSRAAVCRAAGLHAVAGHTGLVPPRGPHPTTLPLTEPGVDLCEGWSPGGDLVPALHHEGVHPAGAVLWTGQQLPRPDHLYHLAVAVAVVRLQSEAVDLPEDDSEGPDVGLGGELAIQDRL